MLSACASSSTLEHRIFNPGGCRVQVQPRVPSLRCIQKSPIAPGKAAMWVSTGCNWGECPAAQKYSSCINFAVVHKREAKSSDTGWRQEFLKLVLAPLDSAELLQRLNDKHSNRFGQRSRNFFAKYGLIVRR